MNYKKLIISLVLPQLAGGLGAIFTTSAIPVWYMGLAKPSFNPPNWIFGPVWLTLYFLMGVSAYLIWMKVGENKKASDALWIFWLHLIFNAIWSPVFFGLQNLFLALMIIAIILFLIVIMIYRFWDINKLASVLLFPYLLWVSFATLLNYYILILN